MSHGTHLNESWHTYEWVMTHIWKHARAPPRALLPLHPEKNQMCVHLCLCLCASLSLSLCLCLCLFLCVDVSVCKYNHIYTYAHACIRIHTHRDRSTKKGNKKGVMSHYDPWYTLTNSRPRHTATHCNTLQHTATHCNTLQYTTTQGIEVLNSRLTVVVCQNMLQDTATHSHIHARQRAYTGSSQLTS